MIGQIEPTYAELSCIVDNLEELGDLPSLWKAVADKFHRANRDNPNDFEYWRKVKISNIDGRLSNNTCMHFELSF